MEGRKGNDGWWGLPPGICQELSELPWTRPPRHFFFNRRSKTRSMKLIQVFWIEEASIQSKKFQKSNPNLYFFSIVNCCRSVWCRVHQQVLSQPRSGSISEFFLGGIAVSVCIKLKGAKSNLIATYGKKHFFQAVFAGEFDDTKRFSWFAQVPQVAALPEALWHL